MNPLWRKAPLLYLRFPGLLAAVAGGMVLLSFVLTGYPLFMSSTENRLLDSGISAGTVTRYGAGVHYEASNVALSGKPRPRRGGIFPGRSQEVAPTERITSVFERRTGAIPGLDPTLVSITGPEVQLGGSIETRPGRLLFRTDAFQHVELVSGGRGDGVWISDLSAEGLRVGVGDTIEVAHQSGTSVRVTVDGIYRALYSQPPTGYWRNFGQLIFVQCPDCSPPPPFVIMDRQRIEEVMRDLRIGDADFGWDAPLSSEAITMDHARSLNASFNSFFGDALRSGELGKVFSCCNRGPFSYNKTTMTFSIDEVISQVEQRMGTITVPGNVILVAAALVAIAAIAAGGAYSAATRRTEVRLLFTRGVGPVAIVTKAALEAVVPAVAGTTVGILLAAALIEGFSSGDVSASAYGDAFRAIAVALVIAVAALATAAVVASHTIARHERPRRRGVIPWEIAAALMGVISFIALARGERPVADNAIADPGQSFLLLLLPLAVVGTGAGLAARAFTFVFRRLKDSRMSSNVAFLTTHRLAGAPGLAVGLLCGSAIAAGVFVSSATLSGSLDRTLDLKARLFVGSSVSAAVPSAYELPPTFDHPTSRVIRVSEAGSVNGEVVDLIAVDPGAIGSVAHWDEALGTDTIDEALGGLEVAGSPTVPVVVAGASEIPKTFRLDVDGVDFDVRVLRDLDAFPGMTSPRPLVIVDIGTFTETLESAGSSLLSSFEASTELWIAGDPEAIQKDVAALPEPPYNVTSVEELKDIPSLSAMIEAFKVLAPLAITAWLAVGIALVVYLQSRSRSQVVSYALSRRMGLSHSSHGLALATEVVAMLVVGYAVAVIVGVGAASITTSFVNPLPVIPPRTVLTIPAAPVAIGAIGSALAAIAAGLFMNRAAARADVPAAMRLSE